MTEDRRLLYENNVQSLPSRKVSTLVGNMIKGYENQENYRQGELGLLQKMLKHVSLLLEAVKG